MLQLKLRRIKKFLDLFSLHLSIFSNECFLKLHSHYIIWYTLFSLIEISFDRKYIQSFQKKLVSVTIRFSRSDISFRYVSVNHLLAMQTWNPIWKNFVIFLFYRKTNWPRFEFQKYLFPNNMPLIVISVLLQFRTYDKKLLMQNGNQFANSNYGRILRI